MNDNWDPDLILAQLTQFEQSCDSSILELDQIDQHLDLWLQSIPDSQPPISPSPSPSPFPSPSPSPNKTTGPSDSTDIELSDIPYQNRAPSLPFELSDSQNTLDFHLSGSGLSSSLLSDSYEENSGTTAPETNEENERQQLLGISQMDLYLLDPVWWCNIFESLPTLKPKQWLDGLMMDYWLITRWISKGRPHIRYLPTAYLHPNQQPETRPAILKFRSWFGLPKDQPCPFSWLIGFTTIGGQEGKGGNHYCVVLFMPEERKIHILGRKYTETSQYNQPSDWIQWGGENIWHNVAILHGWKYDEPMEILELNWIQNGYDCGATACQVIEKIWNNGFLSRSRGFWRKPSLPCCHPLRKQIAVDIHRLTLSNITAFHNLVSAHFPATLNGLFHSSLEDCITQVELVQRALEPNPGTVLKQVTDALDQSMHSCTICSSPQTIKTIQKAIPGLKKKPRREYGDVGDVVIIDQEDQENQDQDQDQDQDQNQDQDQDQDQNQDQDQDQNQEQKKWKQKPKPKKQMAAGSSLLIYNQDYLIKDWAQATIGRFPRPTSPPLLPPLILSHHLRIPSNNGYDEYETGPTLEVLKPLSDSIQSFGDLDLTYFANKVINYPWAEFQDYGYRLEPDFFQAFYLLPPIMVKNHLMPVGLNPNDEEEDSETVSKTRRGNPIHLQDLEILGAREMIALAEKEGSNNIFLTGKTKEGKFIKLDLRRDHVQPQQLLPLLDTDSVVWVTRCPQFKHSINIFTKPVIRNRPPIHKHNHIYVDLLVPQSEQDRLALGSRTEWFTRRFKLSSIPHVQLGKMKDASGSVNLLMAFPRMAHKQPYLPRWATIVPWDIQGILWDKIIIPAMQAVMPDAYHSYVGLDREHLMFKEKEKSGSMSAPSYPFRRNQFIALTQAFQQIIDESLEELSHFGSHFYVLEIKGCKAFTVEIAAHGNLKDAMSMVLDNLHNEYSGLDWEYMQKRELGELYCDIGITYHPKHYEPLTGLWCLDSLEASFGAGGYLQGNIHNLNTLSLYGGLQAEMGVTRFNRTHIIFRSSYNLAYEVTRRKDNARDLFKAKDVYAVNQQFIDDAHKIMDIYTNKAPKKSYGIRDEFRVGYAAVDALINDMDEQVNNMISSAPFVWIPSRIWFNFLKRRLDTLVEHQFQLYQRNPLPPNYGIMTGLFTYLMQSVLFTPPIIDSYIRESLALLNYKASVDRFGMFFLQDLDMTKDICLAEVIQQDDVSILRILGVEVKQRKEAMPSQSISYEDEDEAYPIGKTPTWAEVTHALKHQPWVLMKRWTWPTELAEYEEAEEGSMKYLASWLFQLFTSQVWATLNDGWKKDTTLLNAKTLYDALQCWTLEQVHERLASYVIIPCNANIHGSISGPKVPTFAMRSSLYFSRPQRESEKGVWETLATPPGFIARYKEKIKTLDEDKVDALHEGLEAIFSHCQCLPNGNAGGFSIWEVKHGVVTLFGNPRYYKLQSIGNTKQARRKRRMPTNTGKAALQSALLQLTGLSKSEAKAALKLKKKATKMANKKKLSTRMKNRRMPPKRYPTPTKPAGSEESEGDESLPDIELDLDESEYNGDDDSEESNYGDNDSNKSY